MELQNVLLAATNAPSAVVHKPLAQFAQEADS
jgi:hypothetical protein